MTKNKKQLQKINKLLELTSSLFVIGIILLITGGFIDCILMCIEIFTKESIMSLDLFTTLIMSFLLVPAGVMLVSWVSMIICFIVISVIEEWFYKFPSFLYSKQKVVPNENKAKISDKKEESSTIDLHRKMKT